MEPGCPPPSPASLATSRQLDAPQAIPSKNLALSSEPLAFVPGLVAINKITVLLGDKWFCPCSAKQIVGLVEHRKEHVRKALDDF
ncbi:hypothetical protein GH733_018277 [Mirounga leonina]|nr:hypothetical protein GH733_018277 [Mirounga leonina]